MKNPQRRYKPRKHNFAGEAEARPLVRFLNSTESGQSDIAEALMLFREVVEAIRKTGKRTKFEARTTDPEIVPKAQRMHGLLARYLYRPSFDYDIEAASVNFRWLPKDNEASDRFIQHVKYGIGPYGPESAIPDLLRLSEMGLLSRIRRCACGKWFFARFPMGQQHCSGNCRVAVHRAKAASRRAAASWKERRRIWARNNREVNKRLDSGKKDL